MKLSCCYISTGCISTSLNVCAVNEIIFQFAHRRKDKAEVLVYGRTDEISSVAYQ
jgi:hypothetical protein